jgi:hypothetical protein
MHFCLVLLVAINFFLFTNTPSTPEAFNSVAKNGQAPSDHAINPHEQCLATAHRATLSLHACVTEAEQPTP